MMTPQKKQKIKKAIQKLTNLDSGVVDTFKSLDAEMAKISAKLKETYTDKTLTKVDAEFKTLYKSFSGIPDSLDKIQNGLVNIEASLSNELGSKYSELKKLVDESAMFSQKSTSEVGSQANKRIDAIKSVIERLGGDIRDIGRSRKEDIPMIRREIQSSEKELKRLIETVRTESGRFTGEIESAKSVSAEEAKKLGEKIEELRKELMTKLGHSVDHGGSMNRRTLVDGADYLKKYTDINFVSGNNVTLGVTNNDTLQTTDITINATGGGGGGGSAYLVAQTPDDGTYGLLGGSVNSSNTTFTTPEGQYISGTLVVFLRGKLQIQGASYDWIETTPASGTFDFNTPPLTGDDVTAMYLTTAGGGGGSAGGADTQVQFNDAGSLNGDTAFTWNKNTNTLSVSSVLVGGNAINIFKNVAVAGGNTVVADTISDTLTLIEGSGISITADPSLDSITFNNTAVSTPGGADTEFQYNNAGAFGGVPAMTFNNGSGIISINSADWVFKNDPTTGFSYDTQFITTGNIRTIAIQDQDGTMALLSNIPTDVVSGTGTTDELAYWANTSVLGTLSTSIYPNLTEVSYLKGVTSSVVAINKVQTLTNKTLVTPSIASFAQAQHNHQDGAGGGLLNGSSVFSMTGGQIKTSVLGTGTASSTTFLRGDNTWNQVDLASNVTGDLPFSNLTQGAALTVLANATNGTADFAALAAASDHQVLRRSGTALAFGAVNLAQSAAVTGVLPTANGGADTATYQLVVRAFNNSFAGQTAGTYWLPGFGGTALTTTSGTALVQGPQGLKYLSSANYPGMNGRAPMFRLSIGVFVNNTAPGINYTFGLYPMTSPGSSGGAGVHSWTIGTLVSGSTVAFNTPSANTHYYDTSADFALPADGWYAICFVASGTVAANSLVQQITDLEVHYP